MYDYFFANSIAFTPNQKEILMNHYGNAKKIYELSEKDFAVLNIPTKNIQTFLTEKSKNELRIIYEEFCKSNVEYTTIFDEKYPAKLKQIGQKPYSLFYMGALPAADERCIAIVGARRASAYGKWAAEEIAKTLSMAGFTIVSGMARGIDSCAHNGALLGGGKTIAVLGSGVDVVYPKENQKLYEKIQNNGCVISEYPNKSQPHPEFFPRRNRIISGMCEATIIIEAKEKSGSLITADFALEQGRDIYVLPGRITDPMSAGCNRLIAQGASIIQSTDQLLADLCDLKNLNVINKDNYNLKNVLLEKEDLLLYSCLDFSPQGLEDLQRKTNLQLFVLIDSLYRLIDLGLAKENFVNQYIRIS